MSASETRKKLTTAWKAMSTPQKWTIARKVLGVGVIIVAFILFWLFFWPWTLRNRELFYSGYAFSIIVPIPLLSWLLSLLRWFVEILVEKVDVYKTVPIDGLVTMKKAKEAKAETKGTAWLSVVVGMVERTVITVLVAWSIPGTAAFIGAWVAAKMAAGWSSWSSGTLYARAILFVGLTGSLLSVLFAVIGGVIVKLSY